jgi:hypothetical protein
MGKCCQRAGIIAAIAAGWAVQAQAASLVPTAYAAFSGENERWAHSAGFYRYQFHWGPDRSWPNANVVIPLTGSPNSGSFAVPPSSYEIVTPPPVYTVTPFFPNYGTSDGCVITVTTACQYSALSWSCTDSIQGTLVVHPVGGSQGGTVLAVVPEPASCVLIGGAMGLLALRRRVRSGGRGWDQPVWMACALALTPDVFQRETAHYFKMASNDILNAVGRCSLPRPPHQNAS